MQKLWLVLVIPSLIFMIINSPQNSILALTQAGSDGVSLIIKLAGIYSIWLGFLALIEKSGLDNKIASFLSPIVDKLFKNTSKEAKKYISLNISANMLGMGNAGTPIGLKAMKELNKDHKSNIASLPMIMLVVLNATSLQLLPTTIISLREVAGSLSSTDIILPSIIATTVSTLLGIVLVKLCHKWKKHYGTQ
ncbi:MAG: spore maturation protein [Clostridia bacterium]|nr:spore maturation protein [Clostridia bacterium]